MIRTAAWPAALRRDLTAFATAAAGTPLSDHDTWRRLAGRWEWSAALLVDHLRDQDARHGLPQEHLGAPPPPGPSDLSTGLSAERAGVDRFLDSVGSGLARLADAPDADTRAALVVRLTAGRERLAHLIEGGDTVVTQLPNAVPLGRGRQRHLQARSRFGSWGPLELRLLPWLLHELPAPTRTEVLAGLSPAARLGWRLTRSWFARSERRTFRSALVT